MKLGPRARLARREGLVGDPMLAKTSLQVPGGSIYQATCHMSVSRVRSLKDLFLSLVRLILLPVVHLLLRNRFQQAMNLELPESSSFRRLFRLMQPGNDEHQ
jgi:hypothetical protein